MQRLRTASAKAIVRETFGDITDTLPASTMALTIDNVRYESLKRDSQGWCVLIAHSGYSLGMTDLVAYLLTRLCSSVRHI